MAQDLIRGEPGLAEADVAWVASRLGTLCGFRFGDVQRRSLKMAIARRMDAIGCARFEDYGPRIAGSSDEQGETADLLSEFTNTETHFFRHAGRFRLLRDQVAEGLFASQRRGPDTIRMLSAGCSTGEEAYSSIITLLDLTERRPGTGLEVVGCDINRRALERARLGHYRRWSLRYTPPAIVARHFRPTADERPHFDISSEVQRHATFRWANLVRPDLADEPQMREFDVIFCCNVLIYMTDEAIAQVLANLRAMLADDGYLFLGYAESLQGARREFDAFPARDYVVYRRKKRPAITAGGEAAPAAGPDLGDGDQPALQVHAPALAAERSRPPLAVPAPGSASPERSPATDPAAEPGNRAYARARAQFDADQQLAALAELERLLEARPFHCGARLLKGYIHGSQGAFLEAAAECTKVLDVDPCVAEAYLLRATLLRQAGDVDSAIGEVKKALFLDPDLALGQYLLGKLYQQQGEHDRALRAYANGARTLRRRPELPLAVHVPFELGRDALLHQLERELASRAPRAGT